MAWWTRNNVHLPEALFDEAADAAQQQGYASVDEFIEHCVRQQMTTSSGSTDEEVLKTRLRGLGYVE